MKDKLAFSYFFAYQNTIFWPEAMGYRDGLTSVGFQNQEGSFFPIKL